MLGWVLTILPSRFQFKFEKNEALIRVPGTSKRCVPTLTGEGINTHGFVFDKRIAVVLNDDHISLLDIIINVFLWSGYYLHSPYLEYRICKEQHISSKGYS